MKITKEVIEKIKDEIIDFAKRNKLGNDFSIFYNGKMFTYNVSHKNWRYYPKIKENINPLDYCEYFPEEFILGMAYDGRMYEMINGYISSGIYDQFTKIFEKYGLYMEHMDSCHMALAESETAMNVEYTIFKKEKIEYVYNKDYAPDSVFGKVVELWYEMSRAVGDQGSCVIGANLEMMYKIKKYRVSAQSPYQGSISWEKPLEYIKKIFEIIGATDIYYNAGRMD